MYTETSSLDTTYTLSTETSESGNIDKAETAVSMETSKTEDRQESRY